VDWYNGEHRHSRTGLVTPSQRHRREDAELLKLLKQRKVVYEAARAHHPHRWSGATSNWSRVDHVMLNPDKSEPKNKQAG